MMNPSLFEGGKLSLKAGVSEYAKRLEALSSTLYAQVRDGTDSRLRQKGTFALRHILQTLPLYIWAM